MLDHVSPTSSGLHRQKLNQVALCLTLLSVIPLDVPNQLHCWQLFHLCHPEDKLDCYSTPTDDDTPSLLSQKPDFLPEHLFRKLCNLPVSEADLKSVIESMSRQSERWEHLLQYKMRYCASEI